MSDVLSLEDAPCSPEDYLRAERVSETKHEYLNGDVYAMAGATLAHNFIGANLLLHLGLQLRGTKCYAVGSDMRLRIRRATQTFFYYPDVTVDCSDLRQDETESPTVLFEVLSADSSRADRGEKAFNYQTIASLRVYVIVDQFRPALTIYRRAGNDLWLTEMLTDPRGNLSLPEIGCTLSMTDIYERVFA